MTEAHCADYVEIGSVAETTHCLLNVNESENNMPPRVSIPTHPEALVPSVSSLRAAYDDARLEIERGRGREPRFDSYARQVQDAAFDAFWQALASSCTAIVAQRYPDGAWAGDNVAQVSPTMQVLASSPGSGKTTLAKAFAIALTRSIQTGQFPLGCLLLVQHIDTAQAAYEEFSAHLPGQVAVFSSEHDADRAYRQRPVAFTVAELQDYPILIVTHEFYKNIRGEAARVHTRNGTTLPRVVTFIDEMVTEVEVHDVNRVDFSQVWTCIHRDVHAPKEAVAAMQALLQFTDAKGFAKGDIETRSHDPESWETIVAKTDWLTTDDASHYARSAGAAHPAIDFEGVFGFARGIAENCAFIVRQNGGAQGANFLAYQATLPRVPGMVLLDATADIDGMDELCTWRKHVPPPAHRYSRLDIAHVNSVARGTFTRWWATRPRGQI